jgi:hypothetical protein
MSDGDEVPTGTDETTGGAPVALDEPAVPDATGDEYAEGDSGEDAVEDVASGDTEPAETADPELHPLFAGYDRDGDGAVDLVAFDRNTDGAIDGIIADDDFDGRPDHALLDENLDGRVDAEIIDADEDGNLDLVLLDENRDGQFDTAHFGDEDSNRLPDAGEIDPYSA